MTRLLVAKRLFLKPSSHLSQDGAKAAHDSHEVDDSGSSPLPAISRVSKGETNMLDKTNNYKIDVSNLSTAGDAYPTLSLTSSQNAYKGSPRDSKPNKV